MFGELESTVVQAAARAELRVGVMQGRLSPRPAGKLQEFDQSEFLPSPASHGLARQRCLETGGALFITNLRAQLLTGTRCRTRSSTASSNSCHSAGVKESCFGKPTRAPIATTVLTRTSRNGSR